MNQPTVTAEEALTVSDSMSIPLDVARCRLGAQRLTGAPFTSAVDAVAWFGAAQAQDFDGERDVAMNDG